MTDVYHLLSEIFTKLQTDISSNIYSGSKYIFNDAWFNAAISLSILIYGIYIIKEGVSREKVVRRYISGAFMGAGRAAGASKAATMTTKMMKDTASRVATKAGNLYKKFRGS
jgi:hypothetical protein